MPKLRMSERKCPACGTPDDGEMNGTTKFRQRWEMKGLHQYRCLGSFGGPRFGTLQPHNNPRRTSSNARFSIWSTILGRNSNSSAGSPSAEE